MGQEAEGGDEVNSGERMRILARRQVVVVEGRTTHGDCVNGQKSEVSFHPGTTFLKHPF